ncbi:MAG: aminopeptidase P family protein [Proteobacteria bacterium]|nr:aminopeptidase P family protein [Pseudomonadota bacterium]
MQPTPIFTPPPAAEMQRRLARVREFMRARGLDRYVVAAPENVFYLTNFANFVHERPFVLVVAGTGAPQFVVPRLEIPHVRTRAVGDLDLVEYAEFPAPAGGTWVDRLASLLPRDARVGVESTCPLQVYEAIPATRVRDDAVDDARMIKSDYELGRIAYACGLCSDASRRLLAGAAPGRALIQVAPELTAMTLMRVLRDDPATNMLATRLQAVFQPPSVSHDPHNFTNVNMSMAEGGPHVAIMNFVVNGYGSEIERSFFIGRVPDAARRPFEVMLEARHLAIELTVPGNVMGEVDRRVNDVFRKAGYGEFLLHRTGHGIGVTGHEGPFLADGDERVIEPGMVFTIEPGVYLPGVGGFRHSDTLMTTATGNLSLTEGPESLDELTVQIAR